MCQLAVYPQIDRKTPWERLSCSKFFRALAINKVGSACSRSPALPPFFLVNDAAPQKPGMGWGYPDFGALRRETPRTRLKHRKKTRSGAWLVLSEDVAPVEHLAEAVEVETGLRNRIEGIPERRSRVELILADSSDTACVEVTDKPIQVEVAERGD